MERNVLKWHILNKNNDRIIDHDLPVSGLMGTEEEEGGQINKRRGIVSPLNPQLHTDT